MPRVRAAERNRLFFCGSRVEFGARSSHCATYGIWWPDRLPRQVVLVNLWATWCPPCKAEMPAYQEFYDEHGATGLTVIAINDGEAPGVVRRFVDDRRLTFPVWLDPKYAATEVAFRTANLPTSYVIDRSGVVRLMWIGAIDKPTLDEYVSPLIEE